MGEQCEHGHVLVIFVAKWLKGLSCGIIAVTEVWIFERHKNQCPYLWSLLKVDCGLLKAFFDRGAKEGNEWCKIRHADAIV